MSKLTLKIINEVKKDLELGQNRSLASDRCMGQIHSRKYILYKARLAIGKSYIKGIKVK